MSIEIIDKLKPKNNGKFKLMDAKDVEIDNTDLESYLKKLKLSSNNNDIELPFDFEEFNKKMATLDGDVLKTKLSIKTCNDNYSYVTDKIREIGLSISDMNKKISEDKKTEIAEEKDHEIHIDNEKFMDLIKDVKTEISEGKKTYSANISKLEETVKGLDQTVKQEKQNIEEKLKTFETTTHNFKSSLDEFSSQIDTVKKSYNDKSEKVENCISEFNQMKKLIELKLKTTQIENTKEDDPSKYQGIFDEFKNFVDKKVSGIVKQQQTNTSSISVLEDSIVNKVEKEDLKKELLKIGDDINGNIETITKFQNSIRQDKQGIEASVKEAITKTQEFDGKIEGISKRLSNRIEEVFKNSKSYTNLQLRDYHNENVKTLETDVSLLQKQIATKVSEQEVNNTVADAVNSKLQVISRDIKKNESTIVQTKKGIEQRIEEVDRMTTQILQGLDGKAGSQEVENLNKVVTDIKADVNGIKQSIENVEETRKSLQGDLDGKMTKQDFFDISRKVSSFEETLKHIRQSMEEVQEKNSRIESNLNNKVTQQEVTQEINKKYSSIEEEIGGITQTVGENKRKTTEIDGKLKNKVEYQEFSQYKQTIDSFVWDIKQYGSEVKGSTIIANKDELKCSYENGSFSKMGRDGFSWHGMGMKYPYHFLTYHDDFSIDTNGTNDYIYRDIKLPPRFNFVDIEHINVTASLKGWYKYTGGMFNIENITVSTGRTYKKDGNVYCQIACRGSIRHSSTFKTEGLQVVATIHATA